MYKLSIRQVSLLKWFADNKEVSFTTKEVYEQSSLYDKIWLKASPCYKDLKSLQNNGFIYHPDKWEQSKLGRFHSKDLTKWEVGKLN